MRPNRSTRRKPRARILILVRHAHRDTTRGRELDNGLSKKGQRQAKAIERRYRSVYDNQPVYILSSPKRRCRETVEPLARRQRVRVRFSSLLDEQGAMESEKTFLRRLKKFLRWWRTTRHSRVMVCTHGDWIPAFFSENLALPLSLSKGGWAELEAEGRGHRVTWILQKLQ